VKNVENGRKEKAMSKLTKKLILGKLKTNISSTEVVKLLRIFNKL